VLPANSVSHLYKIAQEAATNAIKHAKGKQICFHLATTDRTLVLKIQNDGKPFPPEVKITDRMGLKIMNYRANVMGGTFQIMTENELTTVCCSIPVHDVRPQPAMDTAFLTGANGSGNGIHPGPAAVPEVGMDRSSRARPSRVA
jgi:signal transduction histidine kinase